METQKQYLIGTNILAKQPTKEQLIALTSKVKQIAETHKLNGQNRELFIKTMTTPVDPSKRPGAVFYNAAVVSHLEKLDAAPIKEAGKVQEETFQNLLIKDFNIFDNKNLKQSTKTTTENIVSNIINNNSYLKETDLKNISIIFRDVAQNMKEPHMDLPSAVIQTENSLFAKQGENMPQSWKIVKNAIKENSGLTLTQITDISEMLQDITHRLDSSTTTPKQALDKVLTLRQRQYIDDAFNIR